MDKLLFLIMTVWLGVVPGLLLSIVLVWLYVRGEFWSRARGVLVGDGKEMTVVVTCLLMGVVVAGIPYAGFLKTTLVPFNNDALAHQILMAKISEAENVARPATTISTEMYEPLTYPFGFHVVGKLKDIQTTQMPKT